MNRHISIILRSITAILILAMSPLGSKAREASYYAASSRLATGKWAKIHVEKTGLQFVSNATLSSLGFSDPSKVNAYGYGGAPIRENLSDIHPDDLPILPTIHTKSGILFFGRDNIRWDRQGPRDATMFSHQLNAYSSDSWYFLSDAAAEPAEPAEAVAPPTASRVTTTFTERLLHEQDLIAPSNTGRVLLGEDFRSPSTRSFSFQLPDNAEGDATFKVAFATRTTTGSSSLMFTANGKQLPSKTTDVIQAISSSEQFMRHAIITRDVEEAGNALQLQIRYQGSGTILLARLDYIEVEYTRRLALRDNQLYFNHIGDTPSILKISGCDASVTVWDVTDPSDIRLVKTTLSGTEASFAAPAGYREYVAFNASAPGYAISRTEKVANQDIHSMEQPDMVIFTPAEYLQPSERLAEHHRKHDGMVVHVLTPEMVYNEFSSGTPDVSAMRKALKMWYDRGAAEGSRRVKYALIMSRPTFDYKSPGASIEWPSVPIWLSEKGVSQTTSYSTDDFIGMLDEAIKSDDFSIGKEKINVAVGRLPVISLDEADKMVDKIIRYVEQPNLGAWRNNIMIIADDQDNAIHLQQAEKVYAEMTATGNGGNFLYERLYLDSYPMVAASTGNTYPEAKSRMLKLWDEGLLYINYIGHASPKEWGHENLLNWSDLHEFNNRNLPFLYAATCEFLRWDDVERSGGEVLWLYPSAGVIGMICPSRTVYITQNGTLNFATHRNIFDRDNGKGKRIGDIMVEGKNGYGNSDDNKLRYCLLGDPAMRLPSPSRDIVVEKIMDTPAGDRDGDLPIIPARGKALISGFVAGPDGNPDEEFNGVLSIQIHDAEIPVETKGNGNSGVVSVYNDRKTRLYSGSCRVKNGRWQTNVLMPSEIENNYSPARMTLYASSDNGIDANGASDRFYVYGFDENAADDNTGPEITTFALNREDFADGDLVHTSPIVLASFSDESGINLSDAGIGHKITLRLDQSTYFEDVNSYYTPDPDDHTSGSVAYPLPELPAGEHTLHLTVWDNANNSSSKSINFQVGVAKEPVIYTLDTDVNPARENVNFLLSTDRPMAKVECIVEVFDLNGRTVWRSNDDTSTDVTAGLSVPWNLCDDSGARVARGIYIYRATVKSPEGTSTTASGKLAVTAP